MPLQHISQGFNTAMRMRWKTTDVVGLRIGFEFIEHQKRREIGALKSCNTLNFDTITI
ncbi:Uncharacterised protein [Vibrio cholerae]|nr:Uncharacterised protein [Vibrio cholerae]